MSIPWKPQPPKPPTTPAIPPLLSLPANAPSRAIQLLQVDPDFPMDHATRMMRTAAAIASHAGVRLTYPPIAKFLQPAWIHFTEDMLPSVRHYAAQHQNHIALLVKTIFIARPTDTRFVGGLGGGRYCLIAAGAALPTLCHEILHPALGAARIDEPDGHRNVPRNVMNGRVFSGSDTNIDPDQAAALRQWASKSAAARVVDEERVWVC